MPRRTTMIDVAPGDETGLYYIVVSNLPFRAKWQKLKDWIRQACPVEKVEVFGATTNGWICVKGLENFEAALKFINETPFKDRMLLAFDKNKTETIKIMVYCN